MSIKHRLAALEELARREHDRHAAQARAAQERHEARLAADAAVDAELEALLAAAPAFDDEVRRVAPAFHAQRRAPAWARLERLAPALGGPTITLPPLILHAAPHGARLADAGPADGAPPRVLDPRTYEWALGPRLQLVQRQHRKQYGVATRVVGSWDAFERLAEPPTDGLPASEELHGRRAALAVLRCTRRLVEFTADGRLLDLALGALEAHADELRG